QTVALLDAEAGVAAHAGLERQAAGEQRRVRRPRLGRVRVGALEQHAVGGERIDRRGLHAGVAVSGEMIGTQRVDREEDDRSVDRGGGARVAPAAGGRQSDGGRGDGEDERVAGPQPHFFNWSTTALACAASGEVGSTSMTLLKASIAALVSPLLS